MKKAKTLAVLFLSALLSAGLFGCNGETETQEINSPVPQQYVVMFNLNGGTLVSGNVEQYVTEGEAAEAPSVTYGSKTLTWDKDFSSITQNTIVNAVWTSQMYTVSFDFGMENLESVHVEVEEGQKAEEPQIPDLETLVFAGWDKDINNVTGDMTVTAKWERKVMSSEEISAYADERTVSVLVHDGAFDVDGSGSGFFIDDQGTIVTNYHVIEYATTISVKLDKDGAEYPVKRILGYNPSHDLAILQIDLTGNKYFEIGTDISKGQTIYAVGAPLGKEGTITAGIISNTSRTTGLIDCIQMDAAISHGNSGGPLVNEYGEVVGVNAYSYSSGENMNLAIKISELDKVSRENVYTINDYKEWWKKEITLCYTPKIDYNSYKDNTYTYSLIRTYDNYTRSTCLLSSDEYITSDDLRADKFSFYICEGYDSRYRYFYYEWNETQESNYVRYLKAIGFEYQEGDQYGDCRDSRYYDARTGTLIEITVTNSRHAVQMVYETPLVIIAIVQ